MKFDTIKEATQAWVREMNAVPMGVVEKLMGEDYEGVQEITPPARYDRITIFSGEYNGESGEIEAYDGETEMYVVNLDNGETVQIEENEFDREDYGGLPMWGTMWAFGDSCDNWWLENGGLQLMADCGFRIYEQEDYGYIFGIDGAGYDFYESHWIPLYKARGLHWHKEEEE